MSYSIWLEFEEFENSEDNDNCYCNIAVTYEDGRREGFTVWTIDYFREMLPEILGDAAKDGYYRMPDFLVTRLEREPISEALKMALPPPG